MQCSIHRTLIYQSKLKYECGSFWGVKRFWVVFIFHWIVNSKVFRAVSFRYWIICAVPVQIKGPLLGVDSQNRHWLLSVRGRPRAVCVVCESQRSFRRFIHFWFVYVWAAIYSGMMHVWVVRGEFRPFLLCFFSSFNDLLMNYVTHGGNREH